MFGELGIMLHIRGQDSWASAWTSYILLEDFHSCLVLEVMLLSYILNESKYVYLAPNVSSTFIDPLEASYVISLSEKTLPLPHDSNWRSQGINFSKDSKCQSKAGLCLRVNYVGGGICRPVSANYDYFRTRI